VVGACGGGSGERRERQTDTSLLNFPELSKIGAIHEPVGGTLNQIITRRSSLVMIFLMAESQGSTEHHMARDGEHMGLCLSCFSPCYYKAARS
jgi:hypothetical protein